MLKIDWTGQAGLEQDISKTPESGILSQVHVRGKRSGRMCCKRHEMHFEDANTHSRTVR